MKQSIIVLALISAACRGSDAGGPKLPKAYSHREEAYFHLAYFYRDSAGNVTHYSTVPNGSYPDTALLRWWKGPADSASGGRVLGKQFGITGNDSLCAILVIASDTLITRLTIESGWRRHGVTSFTSSAGPYDPTNPAGFGAYWELLTMADTLTSTTSNGFGNRHATSFCPAGTPGDSIAVDL